MFYMFYIVKLAGLLVLHWRREIYIDDVLIHGRSEQFVWGEQQIAAFKACQLAVSNCQQLYFLDDTTIPTLQTDASDYGVGAYFYEVRNGKVRVIRFLSKSLTGAQLRWSTIEKECYGLYWAVKMLEEYLDNRRFILKQIIRIYPTSIRHQKERCYDGSYSYKALIFCSTVYLARRYIRIYLMPCPGSVSITSRRR